MTSYISGVVCEMKISSERGCFDARMAGLFQRNERCGSEIDNEGTEKEKKCKSL